MQFVKAKKALGQHFLNDQNIAQKIVDSLQATHIEDVLEIGPGMGVLTQYLLQNTRYKTTVVEIDKESVLYLRLNYPQINSRIIEKDFLRLPLEEYFQHPIAIIGNFPYNISSQILFRVLDYKNQVPEVVGMFQKEVAERIACKPGSKDYGIISVLLQAYYDIEYLFTVHENVFTPPPKVKSGVIRLTRNKVEKLDCNEKLFVQVVKTAFNQRRKMLRNALHSFFRDTVPEHPFFTLRAERLSVADFIELTNFIEAYQSSEA